MTRATRRPSAARLAIQLAILATIGSAISGGCSSGAKTVAGDCGATGALGGAETVNGGASSGASAGTLGMVGEAGQLQAGADGADGGEGGGAAASSQGGESGNAGNAGSGHGGAAGAAGHAGSSSGGTSSAGGHGGTAGTSSTAGNNAGGGATRCGDKVTTPPEFCDDGTNTDLSYGCSACTTLPPPSGGVSQGGAASAPEQCDECLQKDTKPTSCYGCVDYRACYACLRRQPDSFGGDSTFCVANPRDDDPAAQSSNPQSYSDRCFDPNNGEYKAATGGPAGSEPKGLVCQALVACALRTGCVLGPGPTMFANCYCGVVPHGASCADPTFVPNGPCANEVRDADAPGAATTGAGLTLEISTNIATIDPGAQSSALGVAYQITGCAADPHGCADVCFPNSNGSGGTAGVGGSSGHGGS